MLRIHHNMAFYQYVADSHSFRPKPMFKGNQMGPPLVLVCPCFRENVGEIWGMANTFLSRPTNTNTIIFLSQ